MVYWGRWFFGLLMLPFIWGNGINCFPIWFCMFGEYNLAYPIHVWTIWIQISDSKFNIFLAASFIYLVLYALCTWFCKIKKNIFLFFYICLYFWSVFSWKRLKTYVIVWGRLTDGQIIAYLICLLLSFEGHKRRRRKLGVDTEEFGRH